MHLFRPVGLGRRFRARDELGVNRERLRRGGTRQQAEENARSQSRGTSFSMPTSAIWHLDAARQKRELPSLVTTTTRPLSMRRNSPQSSPRRRPGTSFA